MKKSLFLVVLMLLPLMANASENDNLVNAKQKLASLYKYAHKYENKLEGDEGNFRIYDIYDPDSLADINMATDLNHIMYLMLRSQGNLEEISIPRELYNPDVEVEIGTDAIYNKSSMSYYKAGEGTKSIDFDNSVFSAITTKYGCVSHNNFYFIASPSPTSNPHVEIKLLGNTPSTTNTFGLDEPTQVMSGKYDIMVVMVPFWYSLVPNENGIISSEFYDEHYIDSIASITKMSFTGQLRYNNDDARAKDVTSKKSTVIEYNSLKVDTLTVFEDFEFPFSYKDINDSYPTLILEGATQSRTLKKGYIYPLCVDRVILKSKENGEEIVINPHTTVSFTQSQMATIILPTDPDPELGKYYRLDRREEGKIIFEEELAPKAHIPYIIMPEKNFTIDISTLNLDGCYRDSVSVDGITFIGSYVNEEIGYETNFYIDIIDITPDCREDDYCIQKNMIGALRAFLRVDTHWEDPYNPGGTRSIAKQEKLQIVLLDNNDASAINDIQEGTVNGKPTDGAIYDLTGRKVNWQLATGNCQLPKGIYIRNGKKILVK